MTDIFTILKRLRRLPLHHRIAHLRALAEEELPRSFMRKQLLAALKRELLAQLKKEEAA